MRFFSGVEATGSSGDGAAAIAKYVGLYRKNGRLVLDVHRFSYLPVYVVTPNLKYGKGLSAEKKFWK